MPAIYDNINENLADGLCRMLEGARRADFCVGYFNLRGWGRLQAPIEALTGDDSTGDHCRLLIGMALSPLETVEKLYFGDSSRVTQGEISKIKLKALEDFRNQLMKGFPSDENGRALRGLAGQLKTGKLQIKLYTRHPLHAKLYLAHRNDNIVSIGGFVGSSNLTLAGLAHHGELNVDVLEQDAARKLSAWFNERWQDGWSLDISDDLYDIIQESWAGGVKPPYHIYIKTAWHLSREAVEESGRYQLPKDLEQDMLEHQKQAVMLAAQRLNRQDGVIIGDVVGLGKTLLAIAVAKVFQEDYRHNVLVICPPSLISIWEEHIERYRLSARVLSLGKVSELENMRRCHLIIIDESHNLRNRKSRRHRRVRDYIRNNASKVILLTATPYNKAYADIGGQLLLFKEPDEELGVIPDALIAQCKGRSGFSSRHPNTPPDSLSAFEKSEHVDDWRELMRLFMVRRTRAHIKENYAEYDEQKKRHYLTLPSNDRFYFPVREAKLLGFSMKEQDQDDQYARLYSDSIVETISNLRLPRYGLQNYLSEDAPREEEDIKTLSRAGARLRGFARVGLFKRLESSGEAFILSLRRHIIRNATMLAAYEAGAIYIGEVQPEHIDEAGEDDDALFSSGETAEESDSDDMKNDVDAARHDWQAYKQLGARAYERIKQEDNFRWLSSAYFDGALAKDLEDDAVQLLQLLNIVPVWEAEKDRKLAALSRLCAETHGEDKLLIFTQYKDTAEYIYRHLSGTIKQARIVHGGCDSRSIQEAIYSFSPRANKQKRAKSEQTRVLIATDKLSEGVNLQDAHIVVNYDLPWAIIRLIQRAGRVDRIGQSADTIRCYSALPEDGVEKIINLRHRLQHRMAENRDLVGSDEEFFGAKAKREVRQIYECSIDLNDEEQEDDTDLISRAHDIWRQAIKRDSGLESVIRNMPDVVYSAKAADKNSVIAYMRDSRNNHALIELNSEGEIISQSQYQLLEKMKCAPDEEGLQTAAGHHAQVAAAAKHCADAGSLGGQLGGARGLRRRAHDRLRKILDARENALFHDYELLKKIDQLIYDYPLQENARETLSRQLHFGMTDDDFIKKLMSYYNTDDLCVIPKEESGGRPRPQIICSMGLIAAGGAVTNKGDNNE